MTRVACAHRHEWARRGRLAAVVAVAATACHASPTHVPSRAASAAPGIASGANATYQATSDGDTLLVEATFPPGTPDEFPADEDSDPFVRLPERWDGTRWERTSLVHGVLVVPCRNGCRFRYRFQLREAALAFNHVEGMRAFGDAFLGPPSTWLLGATQPYVLDARANRGVFLSGLEEAPPGSHRYRARNPGDEAPFTAIGPWRARRVVVGASTIDLAIAPLAFTVSDDEIEHAVDEAARSIAAYFGSFPVPHLLIAVGNDGGAETMGGDGASIYLPIGPRTGPRELGASWVLTHEMLHVGFPSIPRAQRWLSEGLATYIEPLVRARAGLLTVDALWRDLVRDAPQGLPGPNDGGLDGTTSWGRTYWGGAIFCLLADVQIRQRTGGKRSLDDVLRAIVRTGGTVYSRWNLARVLEIGDAAASVSVLSDLYRRMGHAAVRTNLEELFGTLGVATRGETVVYDDSAPLAWVRKAMTARNPAGPTP